MNIFLIEDDLKVQGFIKENLLHEGYSVSAFSNLNDYSEHSGDPALIILDRLIGNVDSKKYLVEIKKRYPSALILILSALNSPHEKAELLDLGADDYIGKPFSIIELSARIRSLLRRANRVQEYLQVGDLIVNIPERSVSCNGKRIDFTYKEFQVLKCLSPQSGKVFSKFQLMDLVWESNLELESNVLEVTMMNIRKKLTESGSKVEILSKRNIGYWLEV
jgi:DNA-binding response OmpR family regulator